MLFFFTLLHLTLISQSYEIEVGILFLIKILTIIFHKCAKNQDSTGNKLTNSIKQLSRAGVFKA